MRTSLEEIKKIEDYLFRRLKKPDRLVFEARLILEKDLRKKVKWQENAYKLIRLYGRKNLKAEIEAVHDKLFQEPEHASFSQEILKIFAHKK